VAGKLITGIDRISEHMNNSGFSGDRGDVCWSCQFFPSKWAKIRIPDLGAAIVLSDDSTSILPTF
jgi:hypothetical protein